MTGGDPDHDGEARPDAVDHAEYQALRREIEQRIMIQNMSLLLLMPLLLLSVGLMVAWPDQAPVVMLAHLVSTGIGALIWIHGAARTTQIKAYFLLVLEPRLRPADGWERWHARHRVRGRLGSRWRISTIGVFLGSDIATLMLAWLIAPAFPLLLLALAVGGIIVTAILLLPPKMEPDIVARMRASYR